jgi:hypothetical protein
MGLVLLSAAPKSLAAATHRTGSAVTVRGPRMWDPATMKASGYGKQYPFRSSVTVSQTQNLVHQSVRVTWTGFTPTNWQGAPPYNPSITTYPVMIAECRGTHPTLKHLDRCYGADSQGSQATYGTYGPYNTVYEGTSARGRGEAIIDLETVSQNTALGCDSSQPCSLLILPAQGGNKAVKGTAPITFPPFNCGYHGEDAVGGVSTGTATYDFGGIYSPCSWAARIVVPLSFAPTAATCPTTGASLTIAGSPMMATAMTQWDTGFCAGSDPLAVSDIASVPESEAITEVLGGLGDIALTTLPSTIGTTIGTRRYTYAPIGISATVLGYWADQPTSGNPQTGMRLTPRLITKLLTTSYDLGAVSCQPRVTAGCDKGISDQNPPDIFADPDFTGLNPRIVAPGDADGFSDNPIVLQGNSDMTYELTRWIAANPAAEAFLQGTPDGHMTVDKYYKGLHYPASAFATNDPSKYMQVAYSPVSGLGNVASDLVLAAPPGDEYFPSCTPRPSCTYAGFPQEPSGSRALFAVMDNGDAADFDVPVAAIPNHAGRYVEPTRAAMAAALKSMVTAGNGITQQVNLDSNNPAAYPLTMVVYAMVPTAGVPAAKADLIARWLRYVAGPGQLRGDLPGQLAPGYLPLPASMRAKTLAVANAVESGGAAFQTPTPSLPTISATPTPTPSVAATPSPTIALPVVTPRLTTVAVRDPESAGLTRYALPVLLIFGSVAALGGAASLVVGSPGITAALTRRRRSFQAGIKRRRRS